MLQLNAIIDVSFNQQLRRAFPNLTNSKMPAMQKRNIQLKNVFMEIALMKSPPAKFQKLLLAAAIFT